MKLMVGILMLVAAANADTLLGELSRDGMRRKYIKTAGGSFTVSHVERLCRAELKRKPKPNFIMLHVYGETGGDPLPQPAHGRTYDYWRGIYDQTPKVNEIAEMIAIGSNAVVRMREASGRVVRRVLSGQDPLQIDVRGEQYEILHIGFTNPSPYILQRADVFIQTGAFLQKEMGLELLRILKPVFADIEVSVYIRNDPWFINASNYPFFNPLIGDRTPPSQEEYRATPTLSCGYWTGLPTCLPR